MKKSLFCAFLLLFTHSIVTLAEPEKTSDLSGQTIEIGPREVIPKAIEPDKNSKGRVFFKKLVKGAGSGLQGMGRAMTNQKEVNCVTTTVGNQSTTRCETN